MSVRPTAKSPSTAIARVLRDLGLKQGADFRVRGQYANGERTGTYVAVMTKEADQVVADHADQIEEAVQLDGGFTFRVSIHFTAGGRRWTWVANYGERTRDAAPVATADKDGAALDTVSRRNAHDMGYRIVGGPATLPGYKAKLGASRPAFHQPHPAAKAAAGAPDPFETPAVEHPYEGLAQRPFGSLTWACEEAGQVWFFQNTSTSPRYTLRVYHGRAQINGWYLYGGSLAGDRVFMGATLTIAAMASATLILKDKRIADGMDGVHTSDPVGLKVDRTRAAWPKGTRVTGRDTHGKLRNGTVNGRDVGVVTMDGHPNFGRAYVGVTWDSAQPSYADHQRPFADALTRISTTR